MKARLMQPQKAMHRHTQLAGSPGGPAHTYAGSRFIRRAASGRATSAGGAAVATACAILLQHLARGALGAHGLICRSAHLAVHICAVCAGKYVRLFASTLLLFMRQLASVTKQLQQTRAQKHSSHW